MDTLASHLVHFEEFALDSRGRSLRSAGRDIELRPKSFDVLVCLVERPGRLVTKDEIIAAVWPNVSATDESLARCVSDIRNVLGDDERRIIKTVPGRGYVFAVPVLPGIDRQPVLTDAAPSRREAVRRSLPKTWVMTAALLAAVVSVVFVMDLAWPWRASGGLSLPDQPSLAILPFENSSGDAGQDYLSDGIAQDLATSLSKFGELFVIANNSASKYKGRQASPAQIGRELGVRYILKGSVRTDAERIRITVQLVEASRGTQIWAENYDRQSASVFAIQDDVTQNIVTRLVAHINKSELERVARKPVAVWAAHDHYLRGNAIMKTAPRDRTGAIISAARSAYEKSLAIDPNYAPSLQGLALTYWTGWLKPVTDAPIRGEFNDPAVLDRAEHFARRSVDLAPTRAEAWAALGWIRHWQHGPSAGLVEFERAFEFNPNFVDGRYALLLSHAGRASEAIEYMTRAMRLDPLYPLRYKYYLGLSYFLAGRDNDAFGPVREVAVGLPGFPTGYPMLAAIAALTGRNGDARVAAVEVLKSRPNFTISGFLRFMRLERQEDADRLANGLRKAGLPK